MKINYKENVDLSMGAGGRAMHNLIQELILAEFNNEYLAQQADQASLPQLNGRLAFATDSYVVSPLFFPGGDIGTLAINGTVNDLVVGGATPLYIALGLIIEEGFPLADLRLIIKSLACAAAKAKVKVVTGDTKVVEKGKGDGIFINSSGIGVIASNWQPLKPKIGDKIIINGAIAEHGAAILAKRQGLNFTSTISSDCAALNSLVAPVWHHYHSAIRVMRDPTRGGVAAVLNEWANFYKCSFNLLEDSLLIKDDVKGLCELLGLDPLHIANEGKVILIVDPAYSDAILALMRTHPLGAASCIVGEVSATDQIMVSMRTSLGGLRRVEWLSGEQLPRIC